MNRSIVYAPVMAGCWALFCYLPIAFAGVSARYVRVENPTGFVMEWQEIEVFSAGQNHVFKHPEMFSGAVVKDHDPKRREGVGMTDGMKDTHLRGAAFQATFDPETTDCRINPWFEIDLGKEVEIDKVVMYGARSGERLFLDKGHRLLALLDVHRGAAWAAHWNYYDKARYPNGVFAFDVSPAQNPAIGLHVPVGPISGGAENWVPMGWLMGASQSRDAPDAEARLQHFVARESQPEIEKLARHLFSLLADDVPELDDARRLYGAARYAEALDAWKVYWFAKMRRVNMHVAYPKGYFTYATQGDDLLNGLAVTIGDTSATAIRFTPGCIRWIDLPDAGSDKSALAAALTDTEQKAQVGRVAWPLLAEYRSHPNAKYIQRWSEIMDDWAMNFVADAAATPYEAENLFTFSPCNMWGQTMEDLSAMAIEHPTLVDSIPAATLARMQLICLEKYSTAWWRQARETVFNHETGGIVAWANVVPYIDEFYPGRRAAREARQQFERWMTLGTEPDGSMTEIGDDGHMEMPMQLGILLERFDRTKPSWYTPGWRNRATEWYDNNFKYILRHMSPGGFEHRFGIGYRPQRWTSEVKPYHAGRPQAMVQLDRGDVFYAIPEVRRILAALGHISTAMPAPDPRRKSIQDQQHIAHDDVLGLLGQENPGIPHINSDWMPYTGAYYFRGGWNDSAPFLAMMACGSHGGSQPTQWPYGMYYHYDHNYPLVRAQPLRVDGLPPNQLFGRHTFEPGTKTIALTNAEEKPASHRWHSSQRFDFGEAIYRGAYQQLPGFKGDWDYHLEQLPSGKAVENLQTTRQILQLRNSRLFIVTDAVDVCTEQEKARRHQFSIPFKLALSSPQRGASRSFSNNQLRIDSQKDVLRSDNPDGPSVSIYQFANVAVHYRKGADAKLDFSTYGRRLGEVGIAEQEVFTEFEGGRGSTLVSLIASRDRGDVERIESIERSNLSNGAIGFHAKLRSGAEVWYQFAASGREHLTCGPAEAISQSLLFVSGEKPGQASGILLGGQKLSIDGKPVAIMDGNIEFAVGQDGVAKSGIYTPIDPVSFLPNRNAFVGSQLVEMVSRTPNVEIRYTTDGTQPTRDSPLYTGPVKITQSTEFAARAYRLGSDSKALLADDFEVNGTRFSAPTYGWFYKDDFRPAVAISPGDLQPGLDYDYLQAPWWQLYAEAHWLPAAGTGIVQREMDLSKVVTHEAYGMRYKGFIRVPQDGLYTFEAPHELCYMDNAPSYDLRLYIDGQEWYLTQWWHGHGTWSIPLKSGLHDFQLDFADARTTPWQKSGIWRYYPRSWVIYQGKPSDILISGPGMNHSRIPQEWLYRKVVAHASRL